MHLHTPAVSCRFLPRHVPLAPATITENKEWWSPYRRMHLHTPAVSCRFLPRHVPLAPATITKQYRMMRSLQEKASTHSSCIMPFSSSSCSSCSGDYNKTIQNDEVLTHSCCIMPGPSILRFWGRYRAPFPMAKSVLFSQFTTQNFPKLYSLKSQDCLCVVWVTVCCIIWSATY